MYKILIVEDDSSIAKLLSNHIIKYNYDVKNIDDFSKVLEEFKNFNPNLVFLDINLPKFDGFYWCREIRKISKCPIIFISSRAGDIDQIHGIQNGADDYIIKPFSFDLAIAKIESHLRRAYGDYSNIKDENLEIKGLKLLRESFELEYLEKKIELSKKEMQLLILLMSNFEKVVSRQKLLETLWDDMEFVEENTLNVNVARIRKKLENLNAPLKIEVVRSVGYKIMED